MDQLATKILAAHVVAKMAMESALSAYRAELNKNPVALAQALRVCGDAPLEPLYCGFAWVIIPRAGNPGFNKAMAEALKSFGFKHDTAGNWRTLNDEIARDIPSHVRDLGGKTGYQIKGQCGKADWQFHGPGSYYGQSMHVKEVGARAFAQALMADGTVVDARVFTRGD